MKTVSMKRHLTLRIGDEEFSVIAYRDGDSIVIERDAEKFSVQLVSESFVMPATAGAPASTAKVAPTPRTASAPTRPAAAQRRPVQTGPSLPGTIAAPMAGVVKEVLVSAGDSVNAGDRVIVMEAMKMDIDVVAHDSGTVAKVSVAAGENVTEGQQLLQVESGSEA
ncbi:MAG: biotin/lipoyl-containing protein [Spirochaetia bacterium]